MISLIAAVSLNGVIGNEGKLPWSLPEDLKRFKEITYGAPVIMGRKTHESIGFLLPGRKNIIITRSLDRLIPNAWLAPNLERALEIAAHDVTSAKETFVIGGGEIYRLALPMADRLYITEVDLTIEGDATFPEWPGLSRGPVSVAGKALTFREVSREEKKADPVKDRPSFKFLVFDRVK
jgi:dihydrofolate reductase